MSKYNVHDKFIIEIEEIIKGYGNNPETPDIFNLPVLHRIKGFNALVFDEHGLNKLTKVNPQTKIEDIDDMIAEQEIRQKAFNEGMKEAWEMAKLIVNEVWDGGIPTKDIEKMFNCNNYNNVFSSFTPQATKTIIEAWKEKIKILPNDEITRP